MNYRLADAGDISDDGLDDVVITMEKYEIRFLLAYGALYEPDSGPVDGDKHTRISFSPYRGALERAALAKQAIADLRERGYEYTQSMENACVDIALEDGPIYSFMMGVARDVTETAVAS